MALFDTFKPSDDFDKSLDRFNSVVASIPFDNASANQNSDQSTVDTILSAAQEGKQELPEDELSKLFTDLEQPKNRLARFKMYDAIYDNVQIAKRAITVYMNNTFLRNAVSNKHYAFHVKPNIDKSKSEDAKKFAESFFKTQDFFKLLKAITKDTLIYGEGFLEFIDLKDVTVNYPKPDQKNGSIQVVKEEVEPQEFDSRPFKRLITESASKHIELDANQTNQFAEYLLEFDNDEISFEESVLIENDNIESELLLNGSELFNEVGQSDSGEKLDDETDVFKRFVTRYHDPKKIVELKTEYGMTLGYVQLSVDDTPKVSNSTNVMRQFMNSVNMTGGGLNMHGHKIRKKGVTVKIKDFSAAIVSRIISKMNVKLDIHARDKKKAINDYRSEIESKLSPEVLWAVKRLLVSAGESNISNPKIHVRYIKPGNIIRMNYLNGNSVIDTMAYPAKLYLLIQLTNLLSRLSKSATIRKWTLDIGSRENASTVVRKLKEELRNQRITGSNLATSDISNIITDFKDLITVTKNGKSFVDVNVENLGDPANATQDLEFQRNELVAVSGVPASYLGYNDGYELRDQLVHANISFANEIMSVQSEVNNVIMSTLDRAAKASGHDPISDYLTVSLTPPMVLMLQVIETVMASFTTVYSTIHDTMGMTIDPVSTLEQFVPYADWRAILEQGKLFEQEKKVSPPPADQGGFG